MNDDHDRPMTGCTCRFCRKDFWKEENDGNESVCLRCEARLDAVDRSRREDGFDDRED